METLFQYTEIRIGRIREQNQCERQFGNRAQPLLVHMQTQDTQSQGAQGQAKGGKQERPIDGRAL